MKLIAMSFAVAGLTLATASSATEVTVSGDDCRVTRIKPDGSRAAAREARRAASRSRSVSVARSASGGRAHASASASSSTRGGGRSSATSSSTDAAGRSITVTQTNQGCAVVIDDRGGKGAS